MCEYVTIERHTIIITTITKYHTKQKIKLQNAWSFTVTITIS